MHTSLIYHSIVSVLNHDYMHLFITFDITAISAAISAASSAIDTTVCCVFTTIICCTFLKILNYRMKIY